jgi:hypothetical protein
MDHFFIENYSQLDNVQRDKINDLFNKFQSFLSKNELDMLSPETARQYVKSSCKCNDGYDISLLVKSMYSDDIYILLYTCCSCFGEDFEYEYLMDDEGLDHSEYFKSCYVDSKVECPNSIII